MFNLSFWSILRIVYSLLFAISCRYIYNFIQTIENTVKCPLSEGWRINNGKLLSSILMVISVINIFMPASKFLSTLPIIGSSYILLFVLALFLLLFIINRLSINILDRKDNKCKLKGFDIILNYFSESTTLECIYITIIISTIFFYL